MKLSIYNFSRPIENKSCISGFCNQKSGRFRNPKEGLTLVEIICAISILFVVATIGFATLSSFKKTADLSSAADSVLTYLVQARSKTLSAENGAQYGVHIEQNKIVFYSGALYMASIPDNQEILLPETVEIFSIALNGGGDEALFKKLTGETDNDGVIVMRLKSNTSKTKTITIRKVGLAFVQ